MNKEKLKQKFIEKGKLIHNNKYDYSKVEYTDSKTKVCIICHEKDEFGEEHGEFWQIPGDHINKKCGCPKCKGVFRYNTETFIEKASKIHNNFYNYKKTTYVNNKTPIIIICPQHGEFKQLPQDHLKGYGCPKCGQQQISESKFIGTQQFIKKAKQIHKNKYNYKLVDYKGCNEKVTIICPIHGEFEQRPTNHLQGQGCPYCANNIKLTTKEWIEKAQKVHKNKFDYSKVNYINSQTKVCIICPKHGEFWQYPFDHINSKFGCQKCANKVPTTEEFIQKAKQIHESKYDYSKVVYIDEKTPVTIICSKHGEFKQIPSNHLRGSECPKCSQSKGEQNIRKYLELNNIKYIDQYEIQIDKSINPSGKAKIDFYLPDYDLYIEYNGIQHYVPIEYFGGKLRFDIQQKRDQYIRNYCGNKLVEIKYTDQMNINNILDHVLNNKNNYFE